MTRVQEIVEQVRALSPNEQEELRLLLNFELDGDDFELSQEWKAEIRRRVAEFEAGRSSSSTWDDVRSRLRAKIDAAKG